MSTSTRHRVERHVPESDFADGGWNQVGNATDSLEYAHEWGRFWADKHPDDRVRVRSITTTETVEEITAPSTSDQQEGLF